MKRYLPAAIAVALFLFTGCKSKNEPKPSGSDSYLPVSSGSSWTYHEDVNTTTGTTTITLTGGTATFNSKTYYIANTVSDKAGAGTSYFYAGNHAYATRNLNGPDGSVELQMGYDNQAAGYSWITQPTDNGLFEGLAVRTVNTIKETNLAKTVNGKHSPTLSIPRSILNWAMGLKAMLFTIFTWPKA